MQQEKWLEYFKILRRKLNLGWVLQGFEPLFLSFLVLLLCLSFVLKSRFPEFYESLPYLFEMSLIFILLVSVLFAYFWAKKKFFSLREVVLHYDEKYHFNCVLLRAYDGEQDWPELPDNLEGGFTLDFRKTGVFCALSMLIISCIAWIPVSALKQDIPLQQPSSWNQIDRLVTDLEENEMLDQDQISDFREKLNELEEQDPDDWFTHSSLEASESLLSSLMQTSEEQSKNVNQANELLEQIEALREYLEKVEKGEIQVSEEFEQQLRRTLKRLDKEWDDELKDLMRQYMKMNKELMNQMKQMKPSEYVSGAGDVDQEKLKEWLKKMLEQKKNECKDCDKQGCSSCQGLPGMPGIGRGPGWGGDPLGDKESEKQKTKIETVRNEDMNRARPGELLGTSEGEHKLEKERWKGKQTSEGTKNKGSGGDAIWKENLLPEEQELLRSLNQ